MKHKSIKNYDQALQYLGGKHERPYANNTRIELDSLGLGHEVITVKYHGNPVVNFYPDRVSFSSCGWKTSTTKERINWFLPDGFYCYQEKSMWYISNRQEGKRYIFADGLTIQYGKVYNAADESESEAIKTKIKTIKKFVDGYVKALLAGEVESPSGGDCWYCCMVTDESKSLGDATGNTCHIESHIEESYYVPSMVKNAHEFKPISGFAQDAIARIWQGTRSDVSEWQASIMVRDVKRSLTAYLKHCLGIAA